MTNYQYRAYCDICKEAPFGWAVNVHTARLDRKVHFDLFHPDNPMIKQNCRIQRRLAEE